MMRRFFDINRSPVVRLFRCKKQRNAVQVFQVPEPALAKKAKVRPAKHGPKFIPIHDWPYKIWRRVSEAHPWRLVCGTDDQYLAQIALEKMPRRFPGQEIRL